MGWAAVGQQAQSSEDNCSEARSTDRLDLRAGGGPGNGVEGLEVAEYHVV